ncbi:hypothetical protein HK102_007338 [Quaeritorhiza haematococci]|nr:hypothetical protein HK102_007338 [Quaeritorhiza haematococci]
MKPPWRKILYIKQDYDDNYVDHSFLSEMKKNVNLPAKNYLTEVHSAGSITQHLSAILTFVGVFVRLYQNEWDSRAVLAGGAACGALGVFVWGAVVRKGEGHTIKSLPGMIKSAVLLTTTLLSMTPILRTLTKDISDDSIWAMTFMMVLVNVLLRDYVAAVGGGGGAIRFPDSIAINAGIFATVLLASRLEENMQVFVFMMGGVGVFGLFPILQRGVKATSPTGQTILTLASITLTTSMWWSLSPIVLTLYLFGAIGFVSLFAPWWLMRVQRFKDEIHGPWDEARIITNPISGMPNSASTAPTSTS